MVFDVFVIGFLSVKKILRIIYPGLTHSRLASQRVRERDGVDIEAHKAIATANNDLARK